MSAHPQISCGDHQFPEPGDTVRWYPDRGTPMYVTAIVMSGILEGHLNDGRPIPCLRISAVNVMVPVANCRVVHDPIVTEAALDELVADAVGEHP